MKEAAQWQEIRGLPDLLRFENGERVKTEKDWIRRRAELIALFSEYIYGYMPDKEKETVSWSLQEDPETGGMLLHITVYTENGKTEIRDLSYTPLYTWKYKMDGRYYYRCLAADGTIPDGMDSDQQKSMKKAADTVREVMKNSGVEERGGE